MNYDETLALVRAKLADRKILRVAKATGLSRNTVHSVMSGRHNPNASTLALLAQYLGVNDVAS